jgi:hypothetical protein
MAGRLAPATELPPHGGHSTGRFTRSVGVSCGRLAHWPGALAEKFPAGPPITAIRRKNPIGPGVRVKFAVHLQAVNRTFGQPSRAFLHLAEQSYAASSGPDEAPENR